MRALFFSRFPAAGSLRSLAVVGSMLACLSLTGLTGCATPPPADDPEAVAEFKELNDPMEPANRVFYAGNTFVDEAVLAPVARGYRAVVPDGVRTGISNVLFNIGTPIRLTFRSQADKNPYRNPKFHTPSRLRKHTEGGWKKD